MKPLTISQNANQQMHCSFMNVAIFLFGEKIKMHNKFTIIW